MPHRSSASNLAMEIDEQIVSDPSSIAPVRQAVERLASDAGFSDKVTGEVGLCVNEALANVIRHAYAGRTDRPIQVTAHYDPQESELTIHIRDWGNRVNPEQLPPKPHQLDPLKPGGLGMICLRQMMSSVLFTPQRDGMLLTMTRRKG